MIHIITIILIIHRVQPSERLFRRTVGHVCGASGQSPVPYYLSQGIGTTQGVTSEHHWMSFKTETKKYNLKVMTQFAKQQF